MMNAVEKAGAILALFGSIGTGLVVADRHWARSDELERVSQKAIKYYRMNTAQIQLHIVEKDLQYLLDKPESVKTNWDRFKEGQLRNDLKYWSETVKRAEAQIVD